MIFILTFDLPVLWLCTSIESETLWTGELPSSLTRSCVERPSAHSAVLLRHALCHGIPEQEENHTVCPALLLLKENQAASSLRDSFLNFPNSSSSHCLNTCFVCELTLCYWAGISLTVWWLAALKMLGKRGWGTVVGLVGCKKAIPCKANTRELIGTY